MPGIFQTVIGLGITAGLSDREAFVHEISTLINEYQKDPETAQRWAKAAVDYLENLRNNINMKNAIKGAAEEGSLPDKKNVEKLVQAIEELTKEMQKQREKK